MRFAVIGVSGDRKIRGADMRSSAMSASSPATHRTAVGGATRSHAVQPGAVKSGGDWRARGRRQTGAGFGQVYNSRCGGTSCRASDGLRYFGRRWRRQNIVIVRRTIQAGRAIVRVLTNAMFGCMQGDAQLSDHQQGDCQTSTIDDSANHPRRLAPSIYKGNLDDKCRLKQ
jgi:hypothetical protein